MCSSFQAHCPGDVLLILGNIIPRMRSSSQPRHPGDVLLTLWMSPSPCCHFTLVSPRQELVLEPVAKRCKAENARHANVLKQTNNQHSTVLKQWRSLCRLLTSPRSAWADR